MRDNGGHAVALNYSMHAVYGVDTGDVFWAASDVGWVVGHSYIVYGPLIRGCTTILYEGKPVRTPDAGAFWRVIADHRVKTFFVAPTAFRAIKKEDPDGAAEGALRHFVVCEYLFVAGERLDPPTYHWLKEHLADSGDRPLVADRNRLADVREHGRHRTDADETRLADVAGAGLRPAHSRRRWRTGRGERRR